MASGYLFKQLSKTEKIEVLQREHVVVGEIQSKINRIQDQLSKSNVGELRATIVEVGRV